MTSESYPKNHYQYFFLAHIAYHGAPGTVTPMKANNPSCFRPPPARWIIPAKEWQKTVALLLFLFLDSWYRPAGENVGNQLLALRSV